MKAICINLLSYSIITYKYQVFLINRNGQTQFHFENAGNSSSIQHYSK